MQSEHSDSRRFKSVVVLCSVGRDGCTPPHVCPVGRPTTVTLMGHSGADVHLIKAASSVGGGGVFERSARPGSPATIPAMNTLMLAQSEPAQNKPRVR